MQTFEEKLEELEHISEEFQVGNLDIEMALKKFEKAMVLTKTLEKQLAQIEEKIEVLTNTTEIEQNKDQKAQFELFDLDN